MAWYVHIHVCFPCDENDEVAALAGAHLTRLPDDDLDGIREARWFLEDLSARTGRNPGPKGGLSLWGMVGNHTRVDLFCEVLRAFWTDLLEEIPGGPLGFEHVVVFEEQQGREKVIAYEIGRDEKTGVVSIGHHQCSFCWVQM